MDGGEFYDRVTAHPTLEWLGVREGTNPPTGGADARRDPPRGGEVIVGHTATGTKHAVAVSGVLASPWQELEAVLTGERDACIMMHFTRIVGYYSRVSNWNRSKLAELDDRHAGSYGLEDAEGGRRRAGAPGPRRRREAPALV